MSPILQASRGPALRILFRLAFLRKVTLAVRHYLSHMADVRLVVFIRILLRILLKDRYDLAATRDSSATAHALAPRETAQVTFHAQSSLLTRRLYSNRILQIGPVPASP